MRDIVPMSADEFIRQQLDNLARKLQLCFDGCHMLSLAGDIVFGVDDIIRDAVEFRKSQGPPCDKLTMLVTTDGGFIEVVQRIVDVLRHHYNVVDFVVPNYAYSAGTVLVMSGDAIKMDYYSRLGPIDPQFQSINNKMVSGVGYLKQWEALKEKSRKGELTTAEVALLQKLDLAELDAYEQARELSIALLKEWLTKYKFRTWVVTDGTAQVVDDDMRKRRAEEIAKELNNTDRWHVHGYGISMDVLSRDLRLKIDNIEDDPKLALCVKNYHTLLTDYMGKLGQSGIVHSVGFYFPYA